MRPTLTLKAVNWRRARPVLGPLVVILVLTLLSLTLGKFLFDKTLLARGSLKDARLKNQILLAKLRILENANEADLQAKLATALAAIPSSESNLNGVARIRELAATHGLSIGNLKIVKASETGSQSANALEIRFSLEGEAGAILAFITQVRSSLPLMRVAKIQITTAAGASSANLSVISFWQPLPEELGKIDQPLEALDSSDEELLARLAEFQGVVGGEVPPSPPAGRENPFSF